MNANDIHAKLHGALEGAAETLSADSPIAAHQLLRDLVIPLALASIAFELHDIRDEIIDERIQRANAAERGPHGEL